MCTRIAAIYADRTVSKDEVCEILRDGGVAVVTGGGLAWTATKIGHVTINELLNFIPVAGWLVKGGLGGSLTLSVGLAFIGLAEEYWPGKPKPNLEF